jgi:hypothetical protein
MLVTCKFLVSESGVCSHKQIKRYSHCPYTRPEQCHFYAQKSEYKGLTEYGAV